MMIPKLPAWAAYAIIAAVILLAMLALSRCDRDTTAERQAEQTTASSEALANAAKAAVATIENRTVTEKDIDRATVIAQAEVQAAADPAAVRAAVVRHVCQLATHRNDPTCAVR